MSNISTFGTYTMARLGIYASNKALDITGNNISNINTPGYTRQSIDQFSMNMGGADRNQSKMDTRVGSGAFVAGLEQTRDPYLDVRYRTELANAGAMEARSDGYKQISSILDEVGKGDDGEGVMEAAFEEMIQMMQTFNTQGAGKDEFDTLFRSSASTVVNTFHNYAAKLDEIQGNMVLGLRDDVDEVNSLLTRIRDLNVSIRKTQIYGGNSLEQQDERNLLLDKLSEYMKLDITTEKEYLGEKLYVDKLVVKTSDQPARTLVSGIFATQISIRPQYDKDGNPVKDANGSPVYAPDYQLDLGKLLDPNGRALTTTTTEEEPEQSNVVGYLKDEDGNSRIFETEEAAEEALKAAKEAKSEATFEIVPGDGEYRILESASEAANKGYESKEDAEAAMGKMADLSVNNGYAEDGNYYEYGYDIVPKQTKNEDGSVSTVYEVHKIKQFKGEVQLGDQELYGKLQARREILTKQGVFSTAEELAADPAAAGKKGLPYYQKALDVMANTFAKLMNDANVRDKQTNKPPLFSIDGTTDNDGVADGIPITASNISISKSWANGSLRVAPTLNVDSKGNPLLSTANDNLSYMLNILTNDHQYVPQGGYGNLNIGDADKAKSTEVFFTGSFQELLTQHMSGSLAEDKNVADTMLKNYDTMVNDLYVDRDAVMGVDLNDEAMNMMMYEKSYAAACRLMTTYDAMLDKLINGTAV